MLHRDIRLDTIAPCIYADGYALETQSSTVKPLAMADQCPGAAAQGAGRVLGPFSPERHILTSRWFMNVEASLVHMGVLGELPLEMWSQIETCDCQFRWRFAKSDHVG